MDPALDSVSLDTIRKYFRKCQIMKRPILKVKKQAERLCKQLKYTRVTEDYYMTLK